MRAPRALASALALVLALATAMTLAAVGSLATLSDAAAQSASQPAAQSGSRSDAPPFVTVAPSPQGTEVGADAGTDADGAPAGVPIAAVLRGPGGVGYWIIGTDGSIEPVGTTILPILGQSSGLSGPSGPSGLSGEVIGARLGAPGALGLWLQLADGQEVPIGDPGPNVLTGEERPLGWLSGIAVRQLLQGAWWNEVDRWCAAELPVPVKIGQTIMASLSERSLGFATDEARDRRIGGILLQGPVSEHVWRRIAELQEFADRVPLIFAVDEEGGRVQRLAGIIGSLPAAAHQTQRSPAEVTERAANHARQMAELGFTMNFAPVVDVGVSGSIGDRSFSDDPAVVTDYGMATVEGLSAGGVVPVVKHFPGHGSTSVDTHDALGTTAPLASLRVRDLIPFAAVVGSTNAAVMVGHLNVPGLTGGLPASLSPEAIDGLLRDELGHSGLVVTDSLVMGAVRDRWTVSEAALLALRAGADLALVGDLADAAAVFAEIEAAVAEDRLAPERLDEAATNVLRAKGIYACALVGRDGLGRTVLYDPTLVSR